MPPSAYTTFLSALMIILFNSFSHTLLAQTQPFAWQPHIITTEQSISGMIGQDESATYLFSTNQAGDYIVTLEQMGMDLSLQLTTQNNHQFVLNSPLQRDGTERALLHLSDGENISIKIAAEEWTGNLANYSLSIKRVNLPDAEQTNWQLMMEASTAAPNQSSADKYEMAALGWRAMNELELAAESFHSAARISYYWLYEWDRAANLAFAANEMYQQLGKPREAANAKQLAAAAITEKAYTFLDDEAKGVPPDATALFNTALALLEQVTNTYIAVDDEYELARAIGKSGYIYFGMGDYPAASSRLQESVRMLESQREWSARMTPLLSSIVIETNSGNLLKSLALVTNILDELPDSGHEAERANAHDYLGNIFTWLGDIDKALFHYESALNLHRQIADTHGEQDSLKGIALVYQALGKFTLAEQYLLKARTISEAINDGFTRESVNYRLGTLAYIRQDYAAALNLHEKALSDSASTTSRAAYRIAIAKDLLGLKNFESAHNLLDQVLQEAEQSQWLKVRAEAEYQLGLTFAGMGDFAQAIKKLGQAIDYFHQLQDTLQVIDATYQLSHLYSRVGQIEDAIASAQIAVDKADALRVNIAEPELRATFSAQRRSYYEHLINLLMRSYLGNPDQQSNRLTQALLLSEKSHARMTTNLLQESKEKLDQYISPEATQKRKLLIQQLAEIRYQQRQFRDRASQANTNPAELVRLEASVEHSLAVLEAQIRRDNPKYQLTDYQQDLTLQDIQLLLDDKTTLLKYFLGEQQSYLWIVTNKKVTAQLLPDSDTINQQVLAARGSIQTTKEQSDHNLIKLSDMVLAPFADSIATTKVAVIADGTLHYVPFGALFKNTSTRERFIEHHEVVYAPSTTAIGYLRSQLTDRPSFKKTLFIVSDPVFNENDRRFQQAAFDATQVIAYADTTDLIATGNQLGRLYHTATEAKSISGLLSPDQVTSKEGLSANLSEIAKEDLTDYRFLHFATHGIIDTQTPAQSALALSRYTLTGPANSAFLTLDDVYQLNINSDLVVLSACDTALGKRITGEGIVGFTQGFLYAGTKRVIVSLWQVPDQATAELMKHFYHNLLIAGQPPATALRNAQLTMAHSRRWQNPYYWSSLVLVGDWH